MNAVGQPVSGQRLRAVHEKAAEYLLGRQSGNGAFCRYRSEYVDEPNLHDTYHAVAALALVGRAVPRSDDLMAFFEQYPPWDVHALYRRVFSLDLIGRTRIADALAPQCRGVGVPDHREHLAVSCYLERARRTLLLLRRFGESRRFPATIEFIGTLKVAGGFGAKPNLPDTWLGLRSLELLGAPPPGADTQAFIDRLQTRPFGFALTADSDLADLDVLYAGLKCCALAGIEVRYPREALAFALACQSGDGGFSRVPGALPDIEMTRRALQVVRLALGARGGQPVTG